MGPGLSYEDADDDIDKIEIDFGFDNLPESQAQLGKIVKDSVKVKKKPPDMQYEEDKGEHQISSHRSPAEPDFNKEELLELMLADEGFVFDILFEIDLSKIDPGAIAIEMDELRRCILSNDLLMDSVSIDDKIMIEKYIVEHPPNNNIHYTKHEIDELCKIIIMKYLQQSDKKMEEEQLEDVE